MCRRAATDLLVVLGGFGVGRGNLWPLVLAHGRIGTVTGLLYSGFALS